MDGVAPDNGAADVALTANAEARFSESIDPDTLTKDTLTLTKRGDTTVVPATVSYDAATKMATLNPDADLEADATYDATVKGQSNGVKDLAGNSLKQDYTWSFTTAPLPDTVPPTGSVNIKSGAPKTKRLSVSLDLSANDDSGDDGVAQVCVSNTKACSFWMPYSKNVSWRLKAGKAGKRTVFVQFKDTAGNVSPTYMDTIRYVR